MSSKKRIIVSKTKISYPHLSDKNSMVLPKLGKDCIVCRKTAKDNEIFIDVTLKFNNKIIKGLIANGAAQVVCKWVCATTNESGSVRTDKLNFLMKIKGESVNKQIKIYTYIVARRDILQYRNKFSKDVKGGNEFDICEGQYLAVFPVQGLSLDLQEFNMSNMGSIFIINPDRSNSQTGICVDLTGDNIAIRLNETTCRTLMKYGENSSEYKTICTYICTIALIEALRKKNELKYDDSRWIRAINQSMRSKSLEINEDSSNILAVAQQILDNPIENMIFSMNKTKNDNNE